MTITPIEQDAEVAANIRVSNEIRSWLARRQFTHKQLAPVLGISPGSLSWRMKGKTSWSFTELMKIAAWLDISLSKLLGDELVNEKNPHLVSGEGSERVSGGGSNRGPMDYKFYQPLILLDKRFALLREHGPHMQVAAW